MCQSTDCRSCRLITIDTIDGDSSEQELIASISQMRARVDCVDCGSCRLITVDTIDEGPSEQELTLLFFHFL